MQHFDACLLAVGVSGGDVGFANSAGRFFSAQLRRSLFLLAGALFCRALRSQAFQLPVEPLRANLLLPSVQLLWQGVDLDEDLVSPDDLTHLKVGLQDAADERRRTGYVDLSSSIRADVDTS